MAENVGMRVDLEDKGENFTVLTGTTGNHTTEDATVNIQAKLGTVNMKVMSWLDTIKLRKSWESWQRFGIAYDGHSKQIDGHKDPDQFDWGVFSQLPCS